MTLTIAEQLIEKAEKLGLQKGKKMGEELLKMKTLAIVTNLVKKFPEWSDDQICEIANVEAVFVKKVRADLQTKDNPSA